MTHAYEKQLMNWEHGLETVETHLFTVVLKVVYDIIFDIGHTLRGCVD